MRIDIVCVTGLWNNIQSSIRNLLFDPSRLVAKRMINAAVANRTDMIAVATNAGLKVYGFTKFGVTPAGGARAGTLLGLVGLILSPVIRVPIAVVQPSRNSGIRKEQRQQQERGNSKHISSFKNYSLMRLKSKAQ